METNLYCVFRCSGVKTYLALSGSIYITRWAMLLYTHECEFQFRPSKQMVNVDTFKY